MKFTHFDDQGNALTVDIRDKAETRREAAARGSVFMSPQCLEKVAQGIMVKRDVLGVAKAAGIMGAKRISELIPLCHISSLIKLTVDFTIKRESNEIEAACTARTMGKTGVETEALTGASVALLTVYDVCKAADKPMEIEDVYLEHKSGGKSGEFHNPRRVRNRE